MLIQSRTDIRRFAAAQFGPVLIIASAIAAAHFPDFD
jgi:hypothetical protein